MMNYRYSILSYEMKSGLELEGVSQALIPVHSGFGRDRILGTSQRSKIINSPNSDFFEDLRDTAWIIYPVVNGGSDLAFGVSIFLRNLPYLMGSQLELLGVSQPSIS